MEQSYKDLFTKLEAYYRNSGSKFSVPLEWKIFYEWAVQLNKDNVSLNEALEELPDELFNQDMFESYRDSEEGELRDSNVVKEFEPIVMFVYNKT